MSSSAFNRFARPPASKSPAKPRESFLRPHPIQTNLPASHEPDQSSNAVDSSSFPGGTATASNQGGHFSATAVATGGARASAAISGGGEGSPDRSDTSPLSHDPASQWAVNSRMATIKNENEQTVIASTSRGQEGGEKATARVHPPPSRPQHFGNLGGLGAVKQHPTSPLRSPSHTQSSTGSGRTRHTSSAPRARGQGRAH